MAKLAVAKESLRPTPLYFRRTASCAAFSVARSNAFSIASVVSWRRGVYELGPIEIYQSHCHLCFRH